MHRLIEELGQLYEQQILLTGKEARFLVLVSFLAAFLAVRLAAHSVRSGRFFLRNVTVGGRHIHHLTFGIALVLGTGYIGIAFDHQGYDSWLAILFGIGAALTLDEFALWLNLEDVYWTEKGRRSIDAVILAATIVATGLVGSAFFVNAVRATGRFLGIG